MTDSLLLSPAAGLRVVLASAHKAWGVSRANVLEMVTVIATKVIPIHAEPLTDMPKEAFMSDPAFASAAPQRAA